MNAEHSDKPGVFVPYGDVKPESEFEAMERELLNLSARAVQLKQELRQGKVKDLEARGERLIVRPVMVMQPSGNARDPWFGLHAWDWRQIRHEGFDGWMEMTAGSNGPKVMILVDRAIQWLEARCRRQAEERRKAGFITRKERRLHDAAKANKTTKEEATS